MGEGRVEGGGGRVRGKEVSDSGRGREGGRGRWGRREGEVGKEGG